MNVWTEVVAAVPNFNSKRKLKLIGKTRWTSKQDAVDSIISHEENLFVLIKSLLKVCSLPNLDGLSLASASNILNSWLQYGNIVTTFVLHKVFNAVTPATKYLQSKGLNVLDGIKSLRECKDKLRTLSTQLDSYIERAEKFILKLNELMSADDEITELNCECSIRLLVNEEKEKENQRIKKEFSVFIENLIAQIDTKILSDFDENNGIYREISVLDPMIAAKLIACDENSLQIDSLCHLAHVPIEKTTCELEDFISEFNTFVNRPQYVSMLNDDHADYYYDGFACDIDGKCSIKVQSMHEAACHCIQCVLKYITSDEDRIKSYENVLKLYKYVATLPSTQVKCERDFSKLKLIKNRVRSSLNDDSLEDLMIISVESDMFKNIDLENLIDEIVATSKRMSLYMSI